MRWLIAGCAVFVAVAAFSFAAQAEERQARGERFRAQFENAPPEIKAIAEKRQAGGQLTDDEREQLRNYMRRQAEERAAGGRGRRDRGRMMERMLRDAPEDIRNIAEKRRRGEELTQDEQARMREFMRERFAAFAQRMNQVRRRGAAPFIPQVHVNPRDAARLAIAEIRHDRGEYQAAVEVLLQIIQDSPDEEAVAAAHFVAGRIYKENLLLPDKAAEQFLAVRGALAPEAIEQMVAMYDETGEPDQAFRLLRHAADSAEEPIDKAFYLGQLAGAFRRADKLEEALSVLEEVIATFSYDQAMEMKEQMPPPAPMPPVMQMRPPMGMRAGMAGRGR